jgi:hypothetical protein
MASTLGRRRGPKLGTAFAESGKVSYCERPTSRFPAPMANRISVVVGSQRHDPHRWLADANPCPEVVEQLGGRDPRRLGCAHPPSVAPSDTANARTAREKRNTSLPLTMEGGCPQRGDATFVRPCRHQSSPRSVRSGANVGRLWFRAVRSPSQLVIESVAET